MRVKRAILTAGRLCLQPLTELRQDRVVKLVIRAVNLSCQLLHFYLFLIREAPQILLIHEILVSPEFVRDLFPSPHGPVLLRYAASVGMVWGVFLGTAAMAFSLLLVTAVQIAKLLMPKTDEKSAA